MNKRLITLICTFGLIFSVSQTAFAERPIKVLVGGERLESDVAPITVNGRTMLPVRAVFEAIGADVDYIEAEEKVVASKKDKTVSFVIGSNIMTINGEEKEIDVPAMIKNDRTLVPVRACAEAFDLDVEWNDKTHTVKVKKEVSVVSERISANGSCEKYTYDENGNEVYYSRINAQGENYWKEYTYNENGNKTYSISSMVTREEYTYDENENLIHHITWNKDIKYTEIEYEYDDNGKRIYVESELFRPGEDNVVWQKYTYDENGNSIYCEYSTGDWIKTIHDEKGNRIYQENSLNSWHKWIYDENKNLTCYENSQGFQEKYTYDENENLVYKEDSKGRWEKYTYDENGNKTYFKNSDGKWEKYTYDENGNLTCIEYSDGKIEKYIVVVR